jgi:hypothetical protein
MRGKVPRSFQAYCRADQRPITSSNLNNKNPVNLERGWSNVDVAYEIEDVTEI